MFGKNKDEKAELVVIGNDETGKWDVVDQDTNVVSSHDSEELATEAMNNPSDNGDNDDDSDNDNSTKDPAGEKKTEKKTDKKAKKPVAKKPNNVEGISFAAAVKQAAKEKRIVRRTDRVRLIILKATKFYAVGQIIRPHVVYAEQLIADKIAEEAPEKKEAKSKKK